MGCCHVVHQVATAPETVSHSVPQTQIKQRSIHGGERLASVRKKTRLHLGGKAGNGWVTAEPLLKIIRNACAQKRVRQEYFEQEHASAPQSVCMLQQMLPINVGTNMEQHGDVADPGQPIPVVLGPVYTKDEQKVFAAQGPHWRVQKDNCLQALPQRHQVKREMES